MQENLERFGLALRATFEAFYSKDVNMLLSLQECLRNIACSVNLRHTADSGIESVIQEDTVESDLVVFVVYAIFWNYFPSNLCFSNSYQLVDAWCCQFERLHTDDASSLPAIALDAAAALDAIAYSLSVIGSTHVLYCCLVVIS